MLPDQCEVCGAILSDAEVDRWAAREIAYISSVPDHLDPLGASPLLCQLCRDTLPDYVPAPKPVTDWSPLLLDIVLAGLTIAALIAIAWLIAP